MATGKTSTLTYRIEPALKEAQRNPTEHEYHSIGHVAEVMIRDRRRRITTPRQRALFEQGPRPTAGKE